MSQWIKKSTAYTFRLGPFVDETDGFTPETALSIAYTDIKISKNGAALAAKGDTTAPAHDANGYYSVVLNTIDTNTTGTFLVTCKVAGARTVRQEFEVVASGVYIGLVDGGRLGLAGVDVVTVTGDESALVIQGHNNGHGIVIASGATSGNGIQIDAYGTGSGIYTTALGTGHGIKIESNGGNGINSTGGVGYSGIKTSGQGSGGGLQCVSGGSGSGIVATSGASGYGINATGVTGDVNFTTASASSIADAVWDESRSGHVTAGSFGEYTNANLTQIDGLATSGNNATLNLKKLNVINSSGDAVYFESTASGNGLEIRGTENGILVSGDNSGNGYGLWVSGPHGGFKIDATGAIYPGLSISGGGTAGGSGAMQVTNGQGGSAIKLVAYVSGPTQTGKGIEIEAPDVGIEVTASNGSAIVAQSTGGNGSGIIAIGDGTGSDILADITGTVSSVTGAVGSVTSGVTLASPFRPTKNTGYSNFMFPMYDTTTKAPKTGLSVSAYRSIDGNPFSPCSNPAAEIGDGVYRISLSSDDLNGDKIMLRFASTGADDQLIEVFTQG